MYCHILDLGHLPNFEGGQPATFLGSLAISNLALLSAWSIGGHVTFMTASPSWPLLISNFAPSSDWSIGVSHDFDDIITLLANLNFCDHFFSENNTDVGLLSDEPYDASSLKLRAASAASVFKGKGNPQEQILGYTLMLRLSLFCTFFVLR